MGEKEELSKTEEPLEESAELEKSMEVTELNENDSKKDLIEESVLDTSNFVVSASVVEQFLLLEEEKKEASEIGIQTDISTLSDENKEDVLIQDNKNVGKSEESKDVILSEENKDDVIMSEEHMTKDTLNKAQQMEVNDDDDEWAMIEDETVHEAIGSSLFRKGLGLSG